MEYHFGHFETTVVEITNRQQHVEYKIISGMRTDERDVRSCVGNFNGGTYSHCFSGWHSERAPAIERLENEIKKTKELLKQLEFSLKVTRKKKWIQVESSK